MGKIDTERYNKRFMYLVNHIALSDMTTKDWFDVLEWNSPPKLYAFMRFLKQGKNPKTLKKHDLEKINKFINDKLYNGKEELSMLWWENKNLFKLEYKPKGKPAPPNRISSKLNFKRLEFALKLIQAKGVTTKEISKVTGIRDFEVNYNAKNDESTKLIAYLVDYQDIRLSYLLGIDTTVFRKEKNTPN